jgi:lipopolysaccharide/colanic/teichoic acid biosynthesis glycosyltransferase
MYKNFGKRIFDVVVSLAALALLSPVLLIVFLLARWKLGTPVMFRQERPGKNGEPFTVIKFRSMTDERDAAGVLLPDSKRLTPFGCFLRASSVDELPELWNVFKGEMSLVGPRPLLMKYVPYFSDRENTRLTVLPGITGWAQINGRNELGWDDRLEFDAWYVENLSLWLDLKILCLTVMKVVRREKVHVDSGSVIMDLDTERKQRASNHHLSPD